MPAKLCRFLKAYGFSFIAALSNLLAIAATPIDNNLPIFNLDPCPSSEQPPVLNRPVLITLAIPVFIIVLAHVTGCLANTLRNSFRCFQIHIVFLMLYKVVGVTLGIALLILAIVHSHLDVGELGVTALLFVYGHPQDTWNATFKHLVLLRHFPSPSLINNFSEWRRIIKDLIKGATQQDQSCPPDYQAIVLLSFLHRKFSSLSSQQLSEQLDIGNNKRGNSVEQQLLSYPPWLHDYNTNIGEWLHRYFSYQVYSVIPVPPPQPSPPPSPPPRLLTSPVSRESSRQNSCPSAPSIPDTSCLPSSIADQQPPDYTLVNNIQALRILFTIAMYRCIQRSCYEASSRAERMASYWELMNHDLSGGDMQWFFEFIRKHYGSTDMNSVLALEIATDGREL